jgi:hypothetical protein
MHTIRRGVLAAGAPTACISSRGSASETPAEGSMTYGPKLNMAICRLGGLWVYRYKGGCPADEFSAK